MDGKYAETVLIVTAIVLIALSFVDGLINGASSRNYVVITGHSWCCSALHFSKNEKGR